MWYKFLSRCQRFDWGRGLQKCALYDRHWTKWSCWTIQLLAISTSHWKNSNFYCGNQICYFGESFASYFYYSKKNINVIILNLESKPLNKDINVWDRDNQDVEKIRFIYSINE